MNRQYFLNCLHFNYYTTFNHKINSISRINFNAIIENRQRDLREHFYFQFP